MRKPAAVETRTSRIRVLVVSPQKEDHHVLRCMLPPDRWTLFQALSLSSALIRLRTNHNIQLILCERDLSPGSWKDLFCALLALNRPPVFIVTSRLADERLWAEALNVGAYDVLAKPLESSEVNRTLSLAALHCPGGNDLIKPRAAAARCI